MLTRRRNRDTLFVCHTCKFIYLGLGSLLFIFVSIGVFVVEISLNEWVVCIAFVFHIPVDSRSLSVTLRDCFFSLLWLLALRVARLYPALLLCCKRC